MRALLLLLAASLCIVVSACGSGSSPPSSSARAVSSGRSDSPQPVSSAEAAVAANYLGRASAAQHSLANDGDGDQPGDEDHDNSHDIDSDSFADYKHVPDNSVYHDEDDRSALAFGHAASGGDARSVVTLVERYYSAAVAENGAVGCSLLDPGLVRAAALDYGQFGPAYLRGAKTCAEVLSREFTHAHAQFGSPIEITGVRLSGDRGYVFFGSKSLPASDISVMRHGRVWKVGQLLGSPLT